MERERIREIISKQLEEFNNNIKGIVAILSRCPDSNIVINNIKIDVNRALSASFYILYEHTYPYLDKKYEEINDCLKNNNIIFVIEKMDFSEYGRNMQPDNKNYFYQIINEIKRIWFKNIKNTTNEKGITERLNNILKSYIELRRIRIVINKNGNKFEDFY